MRGLPLHVCVFFFPVVQCCAVNQKHVDCAGIAGCIHTDNVLVHSASVLCLESDISALTTVNT